VCFPQAVASQQTSAALSSLPDDIVSWPLSEKALFAAGSAKQLNMIPACTPAHRTCFRLTRPSEAIKPSGRVRSDMTASLFTVPVI